MCLLHELGFYIPEDDILHSHRGETLKSYIFNAGFPAGSRRPPSYGLASSWEV
jgi:hypothetical protein